MPELSCQDLIRFLDDYVDMTQSDKVRVAFDGHLKNCPNCVAYLKTYRDTISLARGACAEDAAAPPPDDIPEELIQIILKSRPSD